MQPAAARVGPSSEPSVRKIAVRFSSGATIFMEKTITGLVSFGGIRSERSRRHASSSQETRQHVMRPASIGKHPLKQQDKKPASGTATNGESERSPRSRRKLRNLGGV